MPSYSIRRYSLFDYPLISSWYLGHGQGCPPAQALPRTGLIAEKDGSPVACVFIYRTDSTIALVECLITNPHSVKLDRREAFLRLWEEVKLEVKRSGHRLLMAMPTHPNIAKFLKERGFNEDPTPYSVLMGEIS